MLKTFPIDHKNKERQGIDMTEKEQKQTRLHKSVKYATGAMIHFSPF